MKEARITFRIDQDIFDDLKKEARIKDEPVSAIVRDAVKYRNEVCIEEEPEDEGLQ